MRLSLPFLLLMLAGCATAPPPQRLPVDLSTNAAGELKLGMGKMSVNYRGGERYEFGCDLGRYGACGGWGKWSFIGVTVGDGANVFDATRQHPLEDALVLERRTRMVAEMLWPELSIRYVRNIDQSDWCYLKISLESSTAVMKVAELQYFAGPDASPAPGRESWVAMRDGERNAGTWQELNLLKKRQPPIIVPPEEYGFVWHLRNDPVNETRGAKFVFLPEEAEAKVEYGAIKLTPRKGVKEIHCAIGHFVGEPYRQALKSFNAGEAQRVLATLRDPATWRVDYDSSQDLKLLAELDALRRNPALDAPFAKANYDALRAGYDQAAARGDARALCKLGREINKFRDELLVDQMRLLLEGKP